MRIRRLVVTVDPGDCDPPHGLDLTRPRDANKVNDLAEAFAASGFDRDKSALVGYPLDGRIQLLSGTHRHRAATLTGERLPVTLWLRSDVEESWGDLDRWRRLMTDIPVRELEAVDVDLEGQEGTL